MRQILNLLGRNFFDFLNKLFPKYDRIIIIPFPNTESGAVETANYLSRKVKYPVYYVQSNKLTDNPSTVLDNNITVLTRTKKIDFGYLLKVLTSKYIFFTHGIFINRFSKRQKVINLWHGLLIKKIGMQLGHPGIDATITVGTSLISKEMFSTAFGVSENTITDTGYPRNDSLLKAKINKNQLLNQIFENSNSYKKIIIWLPTYRKSIQGEIRSDGIETGNPFYINDFDVIGFNNLLERNNTLCFVKPHPMAPTFKDIESLSNLLFINEEWISLRGITLYQLLGCTDILISDTSSVVIDYLLMNKPIVCVSTDLETFRETRGFYKEDIEEWLPGLVENKEDMISYVSHLLEDLKDPYEEKRMRLKNYFFKNDDCKSTERLVNLIFKKEEQCT